MTINFLGKNNYLEAIGMLNFYTTLGLLQIMQFIFFFTIITLQRRWILLFL